MLQFKDIKPYLDVIGDTPQIELLHPYYNQSILEKREVQSLAGDAYPDYMDKNRPRELPSNKVHRKAIWDNAVKPVFSRVRKLVYSISQHSDYVVQFPNDNNQEDNLKKSTTQDFGVDGNLENWVWNEYADYLAKDPNAVIVFLPKEAENQSQRREAIAKILPCENVWMHKKGEFAVLLSDEKTPLEGQNFEYQYTGKILYFFDKDSYSIATQTAVQIEGDKAYMKWDILGLTQNEQGFNLTAIPHFCGMMPVRNFGFALKESKFSRKYELYESIYSKVKTFIKSANQRYSDYQLEALNSVTTLHWIREAPCNHCDGEGEIDKWDSEGLEKNRIVCPTCQGKKIHTQYSANDRIVISASVEKTLTDTKVVNPSGDVAGSIQNDPINMKELYLKFEEEVRKIFEGMGLSSLNYMALEISGKAKVEDKDETIQFMKDVAMHVKGILDFSYWCNAGIIYGMTKKITDLVPTISVPNRFNLDRASEMQADLKEAITSGFDGGIKDILILKYIEQISGAESVQYERYALRIQLDGYRHFSLEQKQNMISNASTLGDRTSVQFTDLMKEIQFSINFENIYQDCTMEVFDFNELTLKEKKVKMLAYGDKYFTVKPANEEIYAFTQRPTVNVVDSKQIN
jgi:hypothetical protein